MMFIIPETSLKVTMRNDSEQKNRTERTGDLEKDQEFNDSMSAGKNRTTNNSKRSSSPDNQPPRKRRRVSEDGPSTSYQHDVKSVQRGKRKASEEGEGSREPAKKERGLLRLVLDKECLSSTMDPYAGTSSSNLESHSVPEGDRRKKNMKRKADDAVEKPRKKKKKTETENDNAYTQRAKFEAKYEEQGPLGDGGCGFVFAGYRKSDNLPVAIKHIQSDRVFCTHRYENGKQVSAEVAIMLELQKGGSGSAGQSSPVSLLDWYDLDQELILVLERPVPAVDLFDYIGEHGGPLEEEEAKVILKQLVDAALHLQQKKIFHRDIKVENILIETGSNVPRVRLIDFGLSCFTTKRAIYNHFYGTKHHATPEWLRFHWYSPGPATVWQLGVVLFDTLHEEPFSSHQFLRKELKISSSLSKDCKDFLKLCFTENPGRRPHLKELQCHPWLT